MKLNRESLKNASVWEEAGFDLPKFDMDEVAKKTYENPKWVHMGINGRWRTVSTR